MEEKVSVIIPCYNVEKYLARCLDSIINQTYKNLEIIIVDDGSPDKSYLVYEEYAKKDDRIKIVKKLNGGLASARNAGLRVATGKYISFIDSDDWIDLDSYEKLVAIMKEDNYDFVRFNYLKEDFSSADGPKPINFGKERDFEEGCYDKAKAERELFYRIIVTESLLMAPILGACASLYNFDFLKKHNLWFDETVKYCEDTIFSAQVVYHAEKFYYAKNLLLYHYFLNNQSISTQYKHDRFKNNKNLYEKMCEVFKDKTDYDFTRQLKLFGMFLIFNTLEQVKFLKTKEERLKEISIVLDDELTKKIFKTPRILKAGLKLKIQCYLIKFRCKKLYERLTR